MQAMGDYSGMLTPSSLSKADSSGGKQGSSTSSEMSDTDRECRMSQHLNGHKGDAEEGRTTDDDLASCSDHLSVEGSNNADEPRQTPGQDAAWPCVSFILSSDAAGSPIAASNSEADEQLKLARLLLSRSKV